MATSLWLRAEQHASLTVAGGESIIDLGATLHNDSINREEWTIVHGIYTYGNDATSTLGLFTLFIVNENLTASDFSDVIPPKDDPSIFFYGQAVTQKTTEIRAKRTIRYNEHVFIRMDISKSVTSNLWFAYQILLVKH